VDDVTWVVQANYLNKERQDNVARILGDLKIPFVGVNLQFFEDPMNFLFEEPKHKRLIPYGSHGLMLRALASDWEGCFFDAKTFRVDTWQRERTDLVNQTAHILTVGEAIQWCRDQKEWTNEFHLRPVEDNKVFSGIVMDIDEIEIWLQKAIDAAYEYRQLLPTTQIAISPVRTLQAEWRWFVVGGQVCDGSMCRMRGLPWKQHETDAAVIEEAQRLADKWLPHPTCVMDVALVDDKPEIIEFNCLNSSGFYSHNVEKIVQAVTDFVKRG
jgi:hypothetical protein